VITVVDSQESHHASFMPSQPRKDIETRGTEVGGQGCHCDRPFRVEQLPYLGKHSILPCVEVE